MNIDSSSSLVPRFGADFWQPYVPPACTGQVATAGDTVDEPALSYSAQLHGTHAAFCQSEDFARYKEEVRANLSFLAGFCRQRNMPDAPRIEENFNSFFRNRFDDYHYFDTRAEMVDAIGKRSLDEFCSMIRNEAIDESKRKTAIWDLSRGVILCADGAVSNLVSAACMLAKSAGGIRGKLWELKEATTANVLRQLIEQRFGHENNYRGNEIHCVNTVWNILADQFGLQQIPDGIRMAEASRDAAFLTVCATEVRDALTPDRLALLIAEACQAQFNSRAARDSKRSSGEWNADIEGEFSEILEDIGDDFGLTSTDKLELGSDGETATLRASDLRMTSFVEITKDENPGSAAGNAGDAEADSDVGAYTYTVRTDPSLIALDVLRAMDALELLQAETNPKHGGDWIDENGMRTALVVYGELAWAVRTPRGEGIHEPVWNSRNAEFALITLPDILQWRAAGSNGGRLPYAAALRQAIHVTPPEQLMKMPPRWLEDAEHLQHFLQRLGTDRATDYLAEHLSVLGSMGVTLTDSEREDVLAQMLRMGLGNAMRGLAEQWLPNSSTYTEVIYAVLLREAVPALHQAMLQEDPKAAVQAWYQPLRESGLLTLVAPHLADMLRTWYIRSPILSYALSNGHSNAVEAFFALLKDLLKDPTVRWHMKDELPRLLATPDTFYTSALSNAMAEGYTDTVQAFYAGLKDLLTDPTLALTVRPALLQALPDLLVGKNINGDCGLAFAVENCNTDIIVAFHAILNALLSDPNIAPHIRRALPDLLAVKVSRNAWALSEAMMHRNIAAMKAFYAILTDPGIMPYIERVMPALLNGMDSYGRTGLSNALAHGNTAGIEAYHDLLKKLLDEPAIAPHIRWKMPDLVSDKNKDGTSGYWFALENGHTAAAAAFFRLLRDPVIAPHTGEDLSFLFSGEQELHPGIATSSAPDAQQSSSD